MQRNPTLAALAVVLRDNRVLLARRGKSPDKGLWGYPGGHVEWGETALQAATRELREETGIEAEAVSYLTNIDLLRAAPDGSTSVHFLLAAVQCRYIGGRAMAADDVSEGHVGEIVEELSSAHLGASEHALRDQVHIGD